MLSFPLLFVVLPSSGDFLLSANVGRSARGAPRGSSVGGIPSSVLSGGCSGGAVCSEVSCVSDDFRSGQCVDLVASSAIPSSWLFPPFELPIDCVLEGSCVAVPGVLPSLVAPVLSSSPLTFGGSPVDSVAGPVFRMRREVFPLYQVLPEPPADGWVAPCERVLRRGELRLSKYFPCFPPLRNLLLPVGVRCGGVLIELRGPMGRVSVASTALFFAAPTSMCAGLISHACTCASVVFNVFLSDDRLGVFLSLMREGEDYLSSGVQLVSFDVERPKLAVSVCSVSAHPVGGDSYSLLGVKGVSLTPRGRVLTWTRQTNAPVSGRGAPVPLDGAGQMYLRSKWTPVNTCVVTLCCPTGSAASDPFVLDCRVALRMAVDSAWDGPRLLLSISLMPRVPSYP